MTTDTQAPELVMPVEVREEAEALIRSLAEAAGDEATVYGLLRTHCRNHPDHQVALGGMVAVLVLMFTECISTSTGPGELAEVSLPIL